MREPDWAGSLSKYDHCQLLQVDILEKDVLTFSKSNNLSAVQYTLPVIRYNIGLA